MEPAHELIGTNHRMAFVHLPRMDSDGFVYVPGTLQTIGLCVRYLDIIFLLDEYDRRRCSSLAW